MLVKEDVGAERCAITRNPDGTVTGNVFFADDRPPALVCCEETEASEDTLLLACFGTDRCGTAPSPPEPWPFLADVELPLSFFESPPTE